MDRLAEIKQKTDLLRHCFQTVGGAPDPAPTLGFCQWLIAEVERLRPLEDMFVRNASAASVARYIADNPRPGAATEGG